MYIVYIICNDMGVYSLQVCATALNPEPYTLTPGTRHILASCPPPSACALGAAFFLLHIIRALTVCLPCSVIVCAHTITLHTLSLCL